MACPDASKSTYAQRLPGVVHSTDAIREELTGEAGDNTQNERVFKVFYERIAQSLTAGEPIVIADATNLQPFARGNLRRIAHENQAQPMVIIFDDISLAFKRNRQRERVVPDHAMKRMLGQYKRALRDIPGEGMKTFKV